MQTHCYNPVAPAYPIWAYYAHGRQRKCQEDPVRLPSDRLEKTTRSSPHHVAQHRPTGSETTPPYAPRSSSFGSEPPSVEDDVDVWRYAIVRVACQKWRRRRARTWTWPMPQLLKPARAATSYNFASPMPCHYTSTLSTLTTITEYCTCTKEQIFKFHTCNNFFHATHSYPIGCPSFFIGSSNDHAVGKSSCNCSVVVSSGYRETNSVNGSNWSAPNGFLFTARVLLVPK